MASAFSAEVQVAVVDAGERHKAKGLLAVCAPDRLRLELWDPMGRTRIVLLLLRGQSWLLLDDTYAVSRAGDELLSRILGQDVKLEALVNVLSGSGAQSGVLGEEIRYQCQTSREGMPAVVDLDVGSELRLQIKLRDLQPFEDLTSAFAEPSAGDRRLMDPSELSTIVWHRIEG